MPSLKINGGNRVLLQLADELSAKDKRCTIYYIDRPGETFKKKHRDYNITSIFGDSVASMILSTILMSIKLRFAKEFEYIVVSDPILGIFSFIYSNKKRVRYVQSNDFELFSQNDKSNFFFDLLYKKLFKVSQKYAYLHVIFNSLYSINSYNKTANEKLSTDLIINPPVFNLNSKFARIRYITPDNPIRVCIISNNHSRKGLKEFIKIAKNTKLKKVNFILITQDFLNINQSNIIIAKPKNDEEYLRILDTGHFILSTSTFEGFGLPLLEGMACGLVPIAIPNLGLVEYNQNNEVSLFNNHQEFDKVITNLMMHPDIYRYKSEQVIKKASFFSIDNFYTKFFSELISQKK